MSIKDPTLISYWIKPVEPEHGLGYGVTARSVEDAIALLRAANFTFDSSKIVVRENVRPEDVDPKHIAPNAGPIVFRGVWYPRLNLGDGSK